MTSRPRARSVPTEHSGLCASADADGCNYVKVTLPEPPSANRWWRNVNGHMVTSEAARDYKADIAKLGDGYLIDGDVSVTVQWHRGRKSGDLDKRLGVALDAMQGVFYRNDSYVTEIHATRVDSPKDAKIIVTVSRALSQSPSSEP